MRSVEVSISHGGTPEVPTWRVVVEFFDPLEKTSGARGEWKGVSPYLMESTEGDILSAAVRQIVRMLHDELVAVCDEHWLVDCDVCVRQSDFLEPF